MVDELRNERARNTVSGTLLVQTVYVQAVSTVQQYPEMLLILVLTV